jgi:hypothetical protein
MKRIFKVLIKEEIYKKTYGRIKFTEAGKLLDESYYVIRTKNF